MSKKHKHKVLYLLRGPSGCGKTTLAKSMDVETVYSTDDYFMKDGEYKFDMNKLRAAHAWNQKRAEQAMRDHVTPLAIDNTFTQAWEMKFYVEKALEFKYKVVFLEPDWNKNLRREDGKWNADFIKSLQAQRKVETGKKIPNQVVDKMCERYDYDVTVDFVLQSLTPEDRKKSRSSLRELKREQQRKIRKRNA